MSYNYAVTAYKATAVTAVLTGSFTGENVLNLILVKGSNLVVNLVTPEGLKSVLDVNIRGRISLAKLIRPPGEAKDLLVFLTARYHMAVVAYDSNTGELVTRAYGNIKDRVGRPTEGPMLGVVDPKCTIMAFHLYAGILKVVPLMLDAGEQLKAFNCRLEDLYAIDVQFLYGCERPTIAYLAEEISGRVLKTTSISVKEKELVKGPWEKISVESQASLLHPMPLPLGGVVVLGAETLCYYNAEERLCIDPPPLKEGIVSCVGKVDDWRCLVGDVQGNLYMLFVEKLERMNDERPAVSGLRLELLGETVAASCLAYLDNGVVFVGSLFGDSQLVKLSTTADESGRFLQVMEHFTNLGPTLDMSVVDLDKQGQDIIISCSGFGKDGSLRIVRSGIGINELASIDLSGIKGIWSLHCGMNEGSGLHNTLVVSFVGQTTVLSLCGEEVEETEIEGLASDEQTFHCSNVTGNKVIQVTSQAVRLIREDDMKLLCKWEAPDGKKISNVACNSSQVAVAVGRDLYYIEIVQDSLQLISNATMPHEVACVDISPLGGQEDGKSSFCAIGLWTEISVSLLKLPSLQQVDNQLLGGDIIPRSILMVSFCEQHYLLCALGDGCLIYYQMQLPTGQLSASKRVVLGTKPIVLKQFKSASSESTNVFACSNHPTIIYTSNQKLLFSNVNLKEVNYLCTLNSEAFRDSLAMVDDSTLTIGSVDQIQMLHIQTIPLGESARRIAHQEESNTFAVACSRIDTFEDGKYLPKRQSVSTSLVNLTICPPVPEMSTSTSDYIKEQEVSTVVLVDQTSFEPIHGLQLLPREHAVCLTSCTLGTSAESRSTYYVVGTALINPTDKEASMGRILVLQVTSNNILQLVHQTLREGAVYQVAPFNGMLVAAVNNEVQIHSWIEEEGELKEVCSHTNNILSLFVKTKGDFILVGDLMRSFKLLVYKHDEKEELEEIAIDINLNPVFLTAIEMIDDETYLGADGRHIFLCQKNSVATVEEDLRYMQQPSRMYVGENINVFGRGSLVMEHPGSSPLPVIGKPILYGGVHGTIGLIGQLKPEVFSLLMKLQNKMTTAIKSVGNIDHEAFRSFGNEHKTKIAEGFIDGDLVEQFLELPQNDMAEICKGIKMTDSQGSEVELQVEDVVKVVEDLSRLH